MTSHPIGPLHAAVIGVLAIELSESLGVDPAASMDRRFTAVSSLWEALRR